jgi:uncharacterized protein YbjQ (UPF0145 family)
VSDDGACLACGEPLKTSMFGSNVSLDEDQVAAINFALDENRTAGCTRCGEEALSQARRKIYVSSPTITAKLTASLPAIPVLSLQQPFGWRYRPIGLATAQTTTGTGLLSELTTAFTDLVGAQSKLYNNKIRDGERLCQQSLRLQALDLGGNAVIGVDIDYAEVGGQRAMLMVCMTGTVVELTSVDGGEPDFLDDLPALRALRRDQVSLEKFAKI